MYKISVEDSRDGDRRMHKKMRNRLKREGERMKGMRGLKYTWILKKRILVQFFTT